MKPYDVEAVVREWRERRADAEAPGGARDEGSHAQ